MAVAIQHTPNQSLMSTIDALWTLIQSQPKAIRKALAQRIVKSDVEAETYRQQTMMKQSIDRAFSELAEAKRTGRELPDAWDLLKELKEDETEREAFLATVHRNASLMFSEKI